ncbi:AAA family ATPase [Roseicyclus amphidinii]|uniref:AAA family ATPase n=1 Tax=Roseicyclus amphidinii TaxID=3034232 RepID=UPI0024E1351A|nr:AAA family ATPase [Roseicyclus sp. Amp-Y-6]
MSDAAPARPLSSAPDLADATAGWQAFAEQIFDRLAEPTHAFWAFEEAQNAAEDEEDNDDTDNDGDDLEADDLPDPETEVDAGDKHDSRDTDGAVAGCPLDHPAGAPEKAPTGLEQCGTDNDATGTPAEAPDDDPDWDHPTDNSPPEDPLAWLDPEQIPGLSTLPIPPIPPHRNPREGLIPRLLPALSVLRLGKTFGSLESLRDRLLARGAITVIATGEAALDRSIEGVLSAILSDRPRSAPALFVDMIADVLEHGSSQKGSFPGLREPLQTALLRGRSVALVAAEAFDLPKPVAGLVPEIIPLAPLDRQILLHALRLIRPDILDLGPYDLPEDATLAGLSLASLALAFRSPDGPSLARRLEQAPETSPAGPKPGPGLHDFPLPQPVRDAVDQLLADLEDWQQGRLPWKDVTRGFLLYGPPGSGKTELARLIAQDAGISFHASSLAKLQSSGSRGSEVIRELRALFAEAAKTAPSIIFLDELDAWGDRARPQDHNSSWTDLVVAGLLECLDGFDAMEGLLTIAATNYPNKIDAALRRPGRFDRLLTLAHPDPDQLPAALRWHLGGALAEADLTPLALQCIGMSGADIARLVRGARALARRQREPLALRHFEASLAETRPPLDEALRWRIAVHEAGHAIAAHATGHGTPRRIAIHAAGGFAETPRVATSATRAEFEAVLITLLAGRAAEKVVLGEVSAGAGGPEDSDLAKATELATALEVSFCLADGLVWRGPPDQATQLLKSDADLRGRVEERLRNAEAQASRILEQSKGGLGSLARTLDENSLLENEELARHLEEACKTSRS